MDMKKIWYAVHDSNYYEDDRGSFSLVEVLAIVEDLIHSGATDIRIAMLDSEDGYCYGYIYPEEV